jgi:formamidopyrimidine-DNA glycosylase
MPELPEVETTRRGIAPHLQGRVIRALVVRQPQLRWRIPSGLAEEVAGRRIDAVERRAKYLLLRIDGGTLFVHLGMSGSLRLVQAGDPPGLHDHVDLELASGRTLRLTDPRRFGAVLWTRDPAEEHPLLRSLGPEPLGGDFQGEYLYVRARGRRAAVKPFIMDQRVVVGVGNIYANEALFRSGIDPRRAAGRISLARYRELAGAIGQVLTEAIEQGGTSLRDFVDGDGRPGYFRQHLQVYGRGGEPCIRCGSPLEQIRLGQRSTVFCPRCQR